MKSRWALTRKRKLSALAEDSGGSTSDAELEAAAIARLPYEDARNRSQGSELRNAFPESHNPYFIAYLKLFEDTLIRNFLRVDSCAKLADKYLLAMVYVYFRRAGLALEEYSRNNFFIALYLANDIEEDDEDEKYEIFPWALGHKWTTLFPAFLRSRDQLWCAMDFRAVVSRRTCEEVLATAPAHVIWSRTRYSHHGGAIRPYLRPHIPAYGRKGPSYCLMCTSSRSEEGGALPEHTPLDLLDEIDLTSNSPKNSKDDNLKAGERRDVDNICSHEE